VKTPVGSSPLARIDIAASGAGGPTQKNALAAAAVAALLHDAKPAVVAAGRAPLDLFEDALRMLPAAARAGIEAAGGLRFSPARGVKVTVTDKIEQDTIRATRGQGIESIDLAAKVPAAGGPLAAWLALMVRWWGEGRGALGAALADRLGDGWTTGSILQVAALCEAIDRGDERIETLHHHLASA
jgi:hypothetical protein